MNNFKLKIVLSVLAGVVFSFVFIILAFAIPTDEKKGYVIKKKAKNKLEEVSHSFRNK